MAWIESHQELERHPKMIDLMNRMGWDLDQTIGKLHRFWWWCVDYCEDGDLGRFNDSQLGFVVGIHDKKLAGDFVNAMVAACWLDRSAGIFRVHHWWKYIGRFLQVKYKTDPKKWQCIREVYMNAYQASQGRFAPASRTDQGIDGGRQTTDGGPGINNGSNNGCKGGCDNGGSNGSNNHIPKPLPLNSKEGGKGTIPRAGDGHQTTDDGHQAGESKEKTPPGVASQGKEDKHVEREALSVERKNHAVTGAATVALTEAGKPRKFVNEIMKQLVELRKQRVHLQNKYPEYKTMPADQKTEYQSIAGKIRELEKELRQA